MHVHVYLGGFWYDQCHLPNVAKSSMLATLVLVDIVGPLVVHLWPEKLDSVRALGNFHFFLGAVLRTIKSQKSLMTKIDTNKIVPTIQDAMAFVKHDTSAAQDEQVVPLTVLS